MHDFDLFSNVICSLVNLLIKKMSKVSNTVFSVFFIQLNVFKFIENYIYIHIHIQFNDFRFGLSHAAPNLLIYIVEHNDVVKHIQLKNYYILIWCIICSGNILKKKSNYNIHSLAPCNSIIFGYPIRWDKKRRTLHVS